MSDPNLGALALAKSKIALASFSRAQEFEADGIGVGISARAGFDPYGASRFLADMQRNADLKAGGEARAPDFLTTHPATPERIKNALANARQFSGPGAGGDGMCDSSVETEDGLVMVLPPELRPASTILIQTGLTTLYVMGPTPIPPLTAGAVYATDGVAFLDGISYLPSTSPLAPKAPARTHIGPAGRALLKQLGLR